MPTDWARALAYAVATAALVTACSKADDPHETAEARGQPCINCHRSAFAAAANPVHAGALPETCGSCHNTNAWSPATVTDHPWFALRGAHSTAPCAGCHTGNPSRYQGTPTNCVDCHRSAYAGATNPAHVGTFPETCVTCHGTTSWSPATLIEHPWFMLDGKHAITPCASCHTGDPRRFAGTPSDCAGCHLADYQRSTYPGHDHFPKTCRDCHGTAAWAPVTAPLHPEAQFPIQTGSHANPAIVCSDCHDSSRGSSAGGKNTDCVHCHLGSHNQPAIDTRPAHTALGSAYPGSAATAPNFCLSCHPAG
jgi:hypothetical protein